MDFKFIGIVIVGIVVVFAISLTIVFPALFSNNVPLSEIQKARTACEFECKIQLQNGADLSSGPCLSNEIIPNWVCDVAHKERTSEDNYPVNQCPSYRKTANRFIEVDPECNFIRAG